MASWSEEGVEAGELVVGEIGKCHWPTSCSAVAAQVFRRRGVVP
ncbi:hypothetical protein [Intrasporangium mesophilum]